MKHLSIVFTTLACLLIGALAGRYQSESWLFFTIASFQIQGAVAALLLALVALVLWRNWFNAVLCLASLAIGIHGFVLLGEYRQAAPLDPGAPPLFRMLSINIMGDNFANGARIADYIVASGADVVLIQESAPIGPHIPKIRAVYPYRLGCGAKTITCDSSLWSKLPLAAGEVVTASPIYRDRLMLAAIDFGGRRVNVANIHLTKPYFDNMHAVELKKVREKMEDFQGRNPGPFVAAGDFNSSILSPDVRKFLKTTDLMTAAEEPHTWPVGVPLVGAAIDHVFVGDPLRIKSLSRQADSLGSNHYGLSAEILWQDNTASYPPQ